jgi:hypothetical protein
MDIGLLLRPTLKEEEDQMSSDLIAASRVEFGCTCELERSLIG